MTHRGHPWQCCAGLAQDWVHGCESNSFPLPVKQPQPPLGPVEKKKMQKMVFLRETFGNVSSSLLRAGTWTQSMEEMLGWSESLCMGLEPTCTHESKAVVGIKTTRSFQFLRHFFSKTFLGRKKKKEKKNIDEAHYTIQTHAWQLPAWSSEFQHKNVQHAANLGMGRNNTVLSRFKI